MADLRPVTCCFSGYRIEKMPFRNEDCPAARELFAALDAAVAEAAADGCTRFLSGMSTGFDLWAAEAVLRARAALPVQLLCAVPFDGQADRFPLEWKRRFNRCLLAADKVYALSRSYHAGCFAARNRFMVDASSRLICYYDGRSGGTAQTAYGRAERTENCKSRGWTAVAVKKGLTGRAVLLFWVSACRMEN
ncbi:MAG: SLOG family protein [Butyricicoccus sp.]